MPQLLAPKWNERTVSVSELRPYERNPRKITKDAYAKLKASLAETGYHQRIIATPDLRVIGGHQRIRAMKELGISAVQVLVPDRDLSDGEFRRVLIQDNISFGEFDIDILSSDFEVKDLADWNIPRGIFAGFPVANDASAEWVGMPEFDQQSKEAHRSLAIHFRDQAAVESFAELIGQKITDHTRFVWFPNIEIDRYADKRYEAVPAAGE